MKKTFALVIAFALFLGACIYVVISSPVPTITHIKFESDKSFIIGINNHDRVTIYHSLDNNKTFSLQLFNAKSLKEACNLIQNRMKNEAIDVTILSMNKKNVDRLKEIIKTETNKKVINFKNPNTDELLTYSDEVMYDLSSTYSKDQIKDISKTIASDIKKEIDIKLENIIDIKDIETKVKEDNFLSFDILKYDLSKYNLSVYDYRKYKVDYHFNEEFTYDIILNMELKEEKEDYIEIYKYSYNYSTDEVTEYKTIFYKQS